MSSTKEINNENSDINDGGALLSLLDIEFDNNTAISENVDNKLDQKSKHNRMLYDPNNRILISSDQGIHGASKEKLTKISKLHHRKPANIESQGLKGVGEKGYVFHFSDLFRNPEYSDTPIIDPSIQAICDKPIKERSPIENLRLAPRYISKTDEFDDDNDTGFNSISLNVIPVVFQNAQYKNVPTTMGPFDMALWNAFSIDTEKPGTISFTHVSQKRHEELMVSLTTVDIQKSLPLFLSTHYHQFLSDDTTMEIGLVSFDIKNENRSLEIKKDIIKLTQIISFDPLHFDKIEPKNKTSGAFLIYKKNKNISVLDNERLQYESEPKEKFIYKNENNELFKMVEKKSLEKEDGKKLVKIENIDSECKYYIEFGKVDHQGTYEHDWKFKDDIILEQIFECSQGKIKNKPSLNGSYTNRNKKQINHSNPPNKTSGDFSLRKAYKNCRFRRSYESNVDEYIPPLLNKSKLAWNNVREELRDLIDLVEKEFREKIGKMYKPPPQPIGALPKPPKPIDISSKKKKLEIESDSESDSDCEYYSESDGNSIASSIKKPTHTPTPKNKKDSTNKPNNVTKQIVKPEPNPPRVVYKKIESDSDDDDASISSISTSNDSVISTNKPNKPKEEEKPGTILVFKKPENIGLTISEQENDSASSSDSDSNSSHKSRIEVVPTPAIRKASKAEYVTKKDCIAQLKNWEQRDESQDELNTQLRIFFKEYSILHEYSFEIIFNMLNIKDKIEIIINQINKKYPYDTDRIEGGINFHRAYTQFVN
jgi:hypothetical protein